jgi:hypothetical protein
MAIGQTNRLDARTAKLAGLVAAARLRLIAVALAAGILLALFLALAWIVGGVLLDLVAPLPVALRSTVFLGWWGAVAAAVGLFVLLPAVRRPLVDGVALRIERLLGGIQNRLLTVIDLHRGGAATRGWKDDPARQGMAERLVEQTEERLRGFSLGRIVRFRALARGAALVAGAAAVLVGLQIGLGERFTTTLARLLHPTADIPPATWLKIESPGDIETLEGDPLGIVARVTRGSVDGVDLVISSADGRDRREPMRPDGDGGFVATLDGLDHDATYRIEGGGTWTKTHAIRLLERPSIESVAGRIRLPDYMRIDEPLRVVPESPRIEAPVGSTVEFSAEVAGEASAGVLRLLDRKLETTLVERFDERVWFEDDLPRDAVAASPWKWTTAHAAGGLRAFTFAADGRPLEMKTRLEPLVLPKESLDDRSLTVMVRRDPSDPPSRLSMQLVHEGGAVEVVWGNDEAGPAADLRVPRIVAGPLPEPGSWRRVAAPLATLPLLVGRSVTGVTFGIDKGRMLLDRPGWVERSMQPVQQPVDRTLEEIAATRVEPAEGEGGGAGGQSTWRAGMPVTLRPAKTVPEPEAAEHSSPRQARRKAQATSEPVWATLEFRSPQGHPSRALPPVEIIGTIDRPPSLVVEEPQSELIQMTALDEFELVAHLFDDWGIDMVGFRVGSDEHSLGDPQALDELPLVQRPPDTQVVLQTAISPDRIGLSPGSSGAFKLAVRDTKGQWSESRAFRITVLVADEQAPPPPEFPALDEALREATQALRLAERDEAILDKKREETLAAIGPEPLAALDRAEKATEMAKEAASEAAAKATDPQSPPEAIAAAAEKKSAAETAATAHSAEAQTRTDSAVANASETVKQDLETLDQYLEARRQDVGQVAGKLAQAAEQARNVPEVSSQQQAQLAAAAEAAAQLRDQLQTSPQFQGDAAKVDRLDDAPKPSEIADRLEQIAEQARAVARQIDAADKAREVDSLVNDLAERAEGLDMLGQQRRDLQAQPGQKPDSPAQAALDRQARNEVRQVNQIVGPQGQKPKAPATPDADALESLVNSGRDMAREAADAAARIADQLAGKAPLTPPAGQGEQGQPGQQPGEQGQGQAPGEGSKPGEGSQPGQGEPGNPSGQARAPSAKELENFLASKEVKETLQMAARAQRLQQQASRRAADQMARGQQGAAQQAASDKQGEGEGQPGAKPTGEPTQTPTDGGTQVGQAVIKEADLRGLDAARRAAIYKLPPRVRDPLLEGMRQRGPAAYQEVIDTYFRHLGRDIPQ